VIATEKDDLVQLSGAFYKKHQVKDGKLVYSAFPKGFWITSSDINKWQMRYKQYLLTDLWASKRKKCLEKFKGHCALCNKEARTAHHRTYDFFYFGEETESDLTALCNGCHHFYHNRFDSLKEVKKQVLLEAKEGGTSCPVCEKPLKPYPLAPYTEMVYQLTRIANYTRETGEKHVDVTGALEFTVGTYSKWRHFGILEKSPPLPDNEKEGRDSRWFVTNKGWDFLNKKIKVNKVIMLNSQVIDVDPKEVGIDDAWKSSFDFDTVKDFNLEHYQEVKKRDGAKAAETLKSKKE
jgi:hypothetical protein